MGQEDALAYRASVARLSYLAQYRSDIQYTVKEQCRFMSQPIASHGARLKRLARYIEQYPRVEVKYEHQERPSSITVWTDSDHGGCLETRKSQMGEVWKCRKIAHR